MVAGGLSLLGSADVLVSLAQISLKLGAVCPGNSGLSERGIRTRAFCGGGAPAASHSAHSQDIFEYTERNPGPLVLLQRGSGRWASLPLS